MQKFLKCILINITSSILRKYWYKQLVTPAANENKSDNSKALLLLTILRTLLLSTYEFNDHSPLALLIEAAKIAGLLFLFQFPHALMDRTSKKLFAIHFAYDFIVVIISVFGLALL